MLTQRLQIPSLRRTAPSLPAVAAILAAAAVWAALLVSLQSGRTTPASASIAWVIGLGIAVAAVLVLIGLFSLFLWRTSSVSPEVIATRSLIACAPLFLAAPFVIAVYRSDEFYHYLINTPIPRSLVIWFAPALMLVVMEVILVWSARLPDRAASLLVRRSAVPALIFIAFSSLYIFTSGGHLYSPDEREMYQVTESIANGRLVSSYRAGTPELENGERRWSKYGLVPSLLALAPYWVSRLAGIQPEPPSPDFPIPDISTPLVSLLVNPLVTAATCSLLYVLAGRMGFSAGVSVLLVLTYGLTTSAWVYSKTFFGQPFGAFCLLGVASLFVRQRRLTPVDFAVSGSILGLAAGTRMELALLALPLGILVVGDLRSDARRGFLAIGAFFLAFVVMTMATTGWYNWAKTGSLFLTGHDEQIRGTDFGFKPYIGFFGALFGSGFGLFTFNPVALVGVFSLAALSVSRRTEATAVSLLLLVSLGLYSLFDVWYGGFTWANRYLTVILPFALLPAGVLLERFHRTPISLMLMGGAAAVGFFVNLLAVLFDFNAGWLDLWRYGPSLTQIQFDPHFSPIGAHVRLLREFLAGGSRLDLYLYHQFGLPSLIFFVGTFLFFITLAARLATGAEVRTSLHPLRQAPLTPDSHAVQG